MLPVTHSFNKSEMVEPGAWKELKLKGPNLQLRIVDASAKGADARPIKSGDTVLLNLVGRQADSPQHLEGTIFQQVKGWLVTIGEPHCLLKCVEIGLENMLEGQRALVYSTPPYHFGNQSTGARKYRASATADMYTLPVSSNVLYEITATQIVMDTSRLNPYFPIQKATTMKAIANDVYQWEWMITGGNYDPRERSIRLYEKTAMSMKTLLGGTYFASVEVDHPQRKQCQQILMDSLNNVIAVHLRAKKWNKAREAASAALREEPKNPKALLRNAKAHVLDNSSSHQEQDKALTKAERVICYRDAEESELKKLRAQFKKLAEEASK